MIPNWGSLLQWTVEYLLMERGNNLRFNDRVKYEKAQFELKGKFNKRLNVNADEMWTLFQDS